MYNSRTMQFEQIQALIQSDLSAVSAEITESTHSTVELIEKMSGHLIDGGGKRLRPTVVLLSALACGYEGKSHILVAAATELLHSATLLHDDVIDDSSQRRGRSTSNAVWGNAAAILVGDYLYAQAFNLLTRLENNQPLLQVLSKATTVITEGEILQLVNRHNPKLSEAQYFEIIASKTAKLFEVSALFGGLLAEAEQPALDALAEYGQQMGLAFQLMDDALDYRGDLEVLGKNIGDDLAEGKATLPLIRALETTSGPIAALVTTSIETGTLEHLAAIQKAIESSGAVDYTLAKARDCVDCALSALSGLADSEYKQGLIGLAQFTVQRAY